MSKQKVVSSLLLSTVVLGGLAFYSTTTVKAESLETDVTSVSSGDVVEKPVVSDGEESDFLAEEEFEDDKTLEEELNEKVGEVAEPSSPEALLQPRAVMSDSMSSGMEEILVDDSDSVSEKIADTPLIQSSNADSPDAKEREKLQKSVTIDSVKLEEKQITWRVNFDTSEWSFNHRRGGLYFVLPKGLDLESIKDNTNNELFSQFPNQVNSSNNGDGAPFRFFNREENSGSFNDQWGWSAGQANPNGMIKGWKEENRFSKIYFIDNITTTTQLTYTLTASVTEPTLKSFPFVAVMKSFGYTNSWRTEVTSLGAREITLEKEKPLPPKETPVPEAPLVPKEEPKKEAPQTPQAPSTPEEKPQVPEEPKPEPEAPQVPEEQPKETPEVSPKPEAPQAPSTPKEEAPKEDAPAPEVPQTPAPESPKQDDVQPEAPSAPEEQPKETPAPEVPSTPEKQPEAPKEEPKQDAPKEEPQVPSIPEEQPKAIPAPPAPSVPEEKPMEAPKPEAPKDTPEVSPKSEAPTEESKKEDEPGQELPKPMEPKVDKPTPEVPKQDDVQPEAPKSDKAETDKPMPETKQPDMKQPKVDDMPKEQKPKADEPKAEQP
ncbi:TPA: cell surface protein, partial [Streptococcus suis]|nr:cell surface protein [Streptococcus suis]HEM6186689.1 cell surface protein [Streptococcus suis]HEM6193191.1 cell surface protein [Streptococcus suis]